MPNKDEGLVILEGIKAELGENATLGEAIDWFTVERNAQALLDQIEADQAEEAETGGIL